MAASALASTVAGALKGESGTLGSVIRGQVNAHASAWMKDKWFGGGRPDYGQVAADAFGNSLAEYVVGRMRSAAEEHREPNLFEKASTALRNWSVDSISDVFDFILPHGAYSPEYEGEKLSEGTDSPSPKKKTNSYTDSEVLDGSDEPSKWSIVEIDGENKVIYPGVKVNFRTGSIPSDEAARLISMAHEGFTHFWSRKISLEGDEYDVRPYLIDDEDGMRITLEESHATSMDEYKRSYNAIGGKFFLGGLGAKIYYQRGAFSTRELADRDFMVTSAHEIGHPLLLEAKGQDYSWGHKNTSGTWGGTFLAPPCRKKGNWIL